MRGAGIVVLCSLLAMLVAGRVIGTLGYDLLYLLKPTVVPEEVVIVYMDDDSHRLLGQPWMRGWDRRQHARLIDRLSALGAKAIVFDILFDLPSVEDPEADRELILAATRAGNVLVAGKIDPILVNGEIVGMKPTPPFDGLRKVTDWGLVEAGTADQPIRNPVVASHRIDSLAIETFRRVAPKSGEPDPGGRWMNYYGPPGTIPWVSYHQIIQGKDVATGSISNKVAFVGALFSVGFTGGRGTDDFPTPYSRWTDRKSPGVEVNATSFLNLLRDDSLRRLPVPVELAITVLCGAIIGGLFALIPPTKAVFLGLALMAVAFLDAGLLSWKANIMFPWLVVGAVQVPVAIVWSIYCGMQRLQVEKSLLEKSLATERNASAPLVVHFSVTSPATVIRGSSFVIDVWAHSQEQREEVLKRATDQSFDTAIIGAQRSKGGSLGGIPMMVRLNIPGLTPAESDESIRWSGHITKAAFLLNVPDSVRDGSKIGMATVSVDGLRVASLHFAIEIGAVAANSLKLVSHENQPRKAFACYSSADRNEVLGRVQGMQKAIPELEVFMDVHSLRSGQNWEDEVRRAIQSCDIFYLFWSANAQASKEVEKEWRFALEIKGRDYINPVPLVSPDQVPPPVELTGKHFNDWTLAFRRGNPTEGDKGATSLRPARWADVP